MKKTTALMLLLLGFHSWAESSPKRSSGKVTPERSQARDSSFQSTSQRRDVVVSGAAGMTYFTLPYPLLMSHLEVALQENFLVGLLTQFTADPVIFTVSLTGRFRFGQSSVKPTIEGGFGLAVVNKDKVLAVPTLTASEAPVGQLGFGVDYEVQPGLVVGTMARVNVAPTVKTLFFTWPVVVLRFSL